MFRKDSGNSQRFLCCVSASGTILASTVPFRMGRIQLIQQSTDMAECRVSNYTSDLSDTVDGRNPKQPPGVNAVRLKHQRLATA